MSSWGPVLAVVVGSAVPGHRGIYPCFFPDLIKTFGVRHEWNNLSDSMSSGWMIAVPTQEPPSVSDAEKCYLQYFWNMYQSQSTQRDWKCPVSRKTQQIREAKAEWPLVPGFSKGSSECKCLCLCGQRVAQVLKGRRGSGLRVGVRGTVVPAPMSGNGPWATSASDSVPGQHEPCPPCVWNWFYPIWCDMVICSDVSVWSAELLIELLCLER